MTSILKLLSALYLAGCFSYSNAQEVVDTTGNLINNNNWSGVVYGVDPNDCCSNPGGSQPLYDTSSNTIKFSYGQATVGQIIGINNALGSSGLQVNGYIFQYDAKTVSENGGGSDPLTSSSYLRDGSGNTLLSTNYQHGVHDWQTFSVTRTLTNPYSISGGGTVGIQFSGYDQGYWAGLYGPEIRNVSLRLNYSVGEDPCIADPLSSTSCPGYAQAYKDQQCSINPLYDTTCPGYAQAYYNQQCGFNPLYDGACPGRSEIITSGNLVPNPGTWHRAVDQSYAINTALSHGGAGLQVHAFRWGFQTFGFLGAGDFKSDVNIRDSNGDSIYSFSTGWQNTGAGYNDRSYYYQLPQSRNNLTLGTFEYNTEVTGLAAVGNFWARMLYTPDSCSLDPLSSPLCTGYEKAFLEQQCTTYTLYSPQCPGYAEALSQMLEGQQTSLSSSATDTTNNISSNTGTTSSASTGAEDPTKAADATTTDLGGGLELSATGTLLVSDGVPAAAKESATKDTVSAERNVDEKKSTLSMSQLLSIAANAVKDAEKTALEAANDAKEQSASEAANPTDGVGLLQDLGGAILSDLQQLAQASTPSTNNESRSSQADRERLSRETSDDIVVQSTDTVKEFSTENVSFVVSVSSIPDTAKIADEKESVEIEQSTKNDTQDAVTVLETNTQQTLIEPVKEPTGPSVRRGGQVEGIQGGVDMRALAQVPTDFNQYLNQQIKDADFYASRDIYRGQVNVDNARALRQLGTDRLHQQMIDQQYNQGAK